MVHNQLIWPYQSETHNSILILTYIGLACLQFWSLLNALHSLVMISPYSTGYGTDNTSSWIMVSQHPKDVIVISSNLIPDPDLSDQFINATVEQV